MARTNVHTTTSNRTGNRIARFYVNTDYDIIISVNERRAYVVDRACRMTFATREYIANLVVAALALGTTLNNTWVVPPLDQLKAAVVKLAEQVPPELVKELLWQPAYANPHLDRMTGPIIINDGWWDSDPDWLKEISSDARRTTDTPRRDALT